MASSQKIIKRRIKTAKNISQITKAMEMVAASKMKKAQKKAISAKTYAAKIYEMTIALTSRKSSKHHPLLIKPKNDNHPLIVLISTNKGLCGSLNLNLFRKVNNFILEKQTSFISEKQTSFISEKQTNNISFDYAILGEKGLNYTLSLEGGFLSDFSDISPFSEAVGPITQAVSQRFLNHKNTSVWLAYNDFINALKQEPTIKQILPLTGLSSKIFENNNVKEQLDYIIEPNAKKILNMLLPFYLETQVREAILEAEASEYSARMIAMKNATDNAYELMSALTLEYNKARQQAITEEISDIVTSKISMEK